MSQVQPHPQQQVLYYHAAQPQPAQAQPVVYTGPEMEIVYLTGKINLLTSVENDQV